MGSSSNVFTTIHEPCCTSIPHDIGVKVEVLEQIPLPIMRLTWDYRLRSSSRVMAGGPHISETESLTLAIFLKIPPAFPAIFQAWQPPE